MVLAAGAPLGPYEIECLVGSGGMGEVYRARDTRLDREVALKVLPSHFAADADRLRRFEQEARAASALNHPNILTVHDVGTHDGAPYIVSELLEGETLRHRVGRGALPLRKALDYAVQMSRGLAAAHDKGIVHRDLKPENVFVTGDGRVKILDFGLAKLTRPEATDSHQGEWPTEVGTDPGAVMGTVGYMSPEQVRGLATDHRSDLFSFGAILYEMVFGQRAFRGETAADTISAILTQDPPAMPEVTLRLPSGLTRIIWHCLEKSPEERFQSARDAAFDLEALSAGSGDGGTVRTAAPARPRRVAAAMVVGLGFLGAYTAGVFVLARGSRAAPAPLAPAFRQLTFQRGTIFSARFAPDGHTVLYGAAWDGRPTQLFSTRVERTESSPLPVPSADVLSVSSSGELALSLGRRYVNGFATTGTLARAPLAGGAPREVLDEVQDADWAPDGTSLAVARRVDGRHRLEFPIGQIVYSTSGWVSHPRVSPRGDMVAFFDHPAYGDDRGAVAVVDRRGQKRVLSDGWASANGLDWYPSGQEVGFTASASGTRHDLYAVDLSGKVRRVLQVPGSLTIHDIFSDGRMLLARDTLRSAVAGLPPGRTEERDLSWHDFSIAADLSDDGRTLLLSEQGGLASPSDVLLRDMDGSPPVRLGEGLAMALSPDRRWVLTLALGSPPGLILLPTRSGDPRRLKRGSIESYGYAAAWYPDGRRVLFVGHEAGRPDRLYSQGIDGAEPVAITPEGTALSVFSDPIGPDGASVAAIAPDGQVVVCRDRAEPTRLSGLEGHTPLGWSRDGRALYALRHLDAARVIIYRYELSTGRKSLIKEIAPAAPGTMSVLHAQLAADANAYVYTYWQLLSDLYLAEGLK